MQILEIGGSPVDEDCAQTGSSHYDFASINRLECKAYIVALKRRYGEPPEGCSLGTKGNAHDFGTYYEVVARFDGEDKEARDYAFRVEHGLATWDEVGMWAPVKYDDRGRIVHILRNPTSWIRATNPECREIIQDETST